jgi:hypothetical protein
MHRQVKRWAAAYALIVVALLGMSAHVAAQTPSTNAAGRWEGALDTGQGVLRLVLDVAKATDGSLTGTLTSVDQGGVRIPIERVELNGKTLRLDVKAVGGNFEGSISDDQKRVTGTWTQGVSLPLEFSRSPASKPPVNEKK